MNGRYGLSRKIALADFGCGKLRHLNVCREFADHLILVDTKDQIQRRQKFGGSVTTMDEYVRSVNTTQDSMSIIDTVDFAQQRNHVDVVLSVAVMDAVLQRTRSHMAEAAFNNLRDGGYFVVIVPRNDSSMLVRCCEDNKFEDGYVFRNRGHSDITFYANFRDSSSLLQLFNKIGFDLVDDLSVFRHICLILQKPQGSI